MTKKNLKADIDFERDLWKAADELRGAVAENQYKDYVLSLIFIKHLSERYDVRKEELQQQLEDPQSKYYTTDKEDINYVLEDSDEYLSRNVLKIPNGSAPSINQHPLAICVRCMLIINSGNPIKQCFYIQVILKY